MSPTQARDFGLIDQVLNKPPKHGHGPEAEQVPISLNE